MGAYGGFAPVWSKKPGTCFHTTRVKVFFRKRRVLLRLNPSLLKKENKIAFFHEVMKSEQKSIRGGLTGALPPWGISNG
jgi:hypothetical protein